MNDMRAAHRPLIALAMGDPAGVSPELAARLLVSERVHQAARLVVIGDRRILNDGAVVAGVIPELQPVSLSDISRQAVTAHAFVDLGNLAPVDVRRGEAALIGGRFAIENFRNALELGRDGKVDAVCFTPFNKKAMRLAYPGYDDEIRFIADVLQFPQKMREFNVLEKIWNARVTSHIPLSAVASHMSQEAILAELDLTRRCLVKAGIAEPKIAVAGLNPHAGDGGSFGMEEIDIIEPAVIQSVEMGWQVEGPFPADTVFLTALKGGFHAVLTMYHDQGQIAMKMMGFDRGVTMLGGLPFPVCTPAHGTAYDIAGKGIANVGASEEAVLLAARMVAQGEASAA
ncbi:4-hydroxythreonine-4-phosphate dehydrogenase PdxA [Agrobacterium rhizogenes]|nr:4-hydroxythreonine-4-phosphate dehydrogenase PdxA [Rhizobium rhizogenes]NTJ78411.1 4-hydroxythreonine-4-phosphate dehydrogenase PdxA [Rhizobium rhizogenes]